MGYYCNTDIGKRNNSIKKNKKVIPTSKKKTNNQSFHSLAVGVSIILNILFVLPVFSILFGCILALSEITTLNELQTKLFPFLFKNVAIMGIIGILIFLTNLLNKQPH